ncbi:MAG: AmmeMemoRadiSam system radical SAM enzyme [Thermodesulfovibrio sp.]|nr:AmmeMemoRadiSam system radical SAM enzyme [Thermodesulfovibrio sp.]
MKEALFYEKLLDKKVKCNLCNHHCIISEKSRGICGVRENRDGVLHTLVYGKVIAYHIDPIEKKPLFHFYPGSASYSIATVGCNFHCLHCQNYTISQYTKFYENIPGEDFSAEDVVKEAKAAGCESISYTYTEPTVFLEFAYDCMVLASQQRIKNVFVSNGYMSEEVVKFIAPYLNGINIDLKGDEDFYKKICGAKLEPVMNNIELFKKLGVWVEVTTLIIPDHNDSETFLRRAAKFIASIDSSIPWHVTQFYPTYKLTDKPRTPIEILKKARKIGFEEGLKFVYTGNVPGEGGENTYCPNCKKLIIERFGYFITKLNIKNSKCIYCGNLIEGVGLP